MTGSAWIITVTGCSFSAGTAVGSTAGFSGSAIAVPTGILSTITVDSVENISSSATSIT